MYCDTLLSKKWELLSSKWDGKIESLSQESIWYAANDALYALKIFEGMVKMPKEVPKVFPDFDSGFKGLAHFYKGKKGKLDVEVKKPVRGPYKPKRKIDVETERVGRKYVKKS